ncbi:hypothetical protein Btru_031511 [Bulinus truncatus]|nr:hypothetical protein Btru_031511 [Bulinus truncatus]
MSTPKVKKSGHFQKLKDCTVENNMAARVDEEKVSNVVDLVATTEEQINMSSTSNWRCQRCTLINADSLAVCLVCEAPRRSRLPTISDIESSIENSHVRSIPDKEIIDLTLAQGEGPSKKDSEKMMGCSTTNNFPGTSNFIDIDEEWKCKDCTFSCNPAWENSCQVCRKPKFPQSVKERDSASPPYPIYINNDSVSYTHRPNKQSPIQHTKAQPQWICAKCTFENSPDSLQCSMCSGPKSSNWICDYCTFNNNAGRGVCSMCHMPRVVTEKGTFHETSPPDNLQKRKDPSIPKPLYELLRQESSLVEDIRITEEKEASELQKRIIQHCQITGDPFVDDSFPPAPKSLFLDPKKPFFMPENQGVLFNASNIHWLRPKDIEVPDRSTVPWAVYRTPMPEDIFQGILSDCWFFSALAVLAERSHLVEHIVISKDICKEGVYQVRLCKDGLWKTILIDDYLPCNSHRHLIFAQARKRQLWVPLIEKAMAKMYGSYEALIGGKCIEGLATLTGAPCESIQLQNGSNNRSEEICTDLIWAKLMSCRDMKFLMGASCGGGHMNANEEDFSKVGLRSKHSYSILDVQDLEGNKLVRLRNPWGRYSWKGDWSDGSSKWKEVSEAARNNLLSFGEEHGVFWMEFSDLMKYFDSIDVCKIHPGWEERRIQGTFPINGKSPLKLIKLSILQTTEVELGLFQEGPRGAQIKKIFLDLCIVVLKETQNAQLASVGHLVVHSPRQLKGFVGCNHMFSPGEYILVPFAFSQWRNALEVSRPSYVLTIHSSKKLMVCENICDRPYLLTDALIQLAVAKGSREELRPGITAYSLMKGWAGCIFVVENRLQDKHIHLAIDCMDSMNIVSTRETLKTVDVIPPYHRQVVLILTHLERSEGYHLSRKLLHRPLSSSELPPRHHEPELTPEIASLHSPRPYV